MERKDRAISGNDIYGWRQAWKGIRVNKGVRVKEDWKGAIRERAKKKVTMQGTERECESNCGVCDCCWIWNWTTILLYLSFFSFSVKWNDAEDAAHRAFVFAVVVEKKKGSRMYSW